MRIDRFTQKMQEALQSAQDLAAQYNHPEVGNEHFLLALLQQPEGIARPLLGQLQVPVDQLQQQLQLQLEQRPKVVGSSVDIRIGNNLRTVLDAAEREMTRLRDE
jgi:ATP-dependent Clp protease ATP-binding subunit ClpB